MSFDNPYVTAEFMTLTPGQVRYYEEVKRIISGIVDQPDGMMYILNALALTGDKLLPRCSYGSMKQPVVRWTLEILRVLSTNVHSANPC